MNSNQRYIEAKKRLDALDKKRIELSNMLLNEELKEEAKEKHLLEAYRKACDEARDRVHRARTVEREELERLTGEVSRLIHEMDQMPRCDHKDENGNVALKSYHPYGSVDGDSSMVTCTICRETWQ
jgi:hypothetical protein